MPPRKSPPPPLQPKAPAQQERRLDKGKGREAAPAQPGTLSRNASHSHRSRSRSRAGSHSERDEEDDDAPPTSSLRARNVTGSSMLDFPSPGSPSTPPPKSADSTRTSEGGGFPGGWKGPLPGVKGTMGGISSPRSAGFPSSPAPSSATVRNFAERDHDNNGRAMTPRQRTPLTFRTDPTVASCLDTMPLGSRDEIKRLFGVA